MKCIVLCAGYATRLYPLAENFPKPLLPVGEKTIIDWLIDDIDSCRLISEYIIVSNHKYIRDFNDWKNSKTQKITVLDDGSTTNDNRLGAVCDIKFAVDKLCLDDDVLVIAGDNVLDFSLCRFIEYALNKKSSCVMRYFEPDMKRISKSAVVTTDKNDKILAMEEKPINPSDNWCCPPFYYYTKDDIKMIGIAIEEGCKTDSSPFKENELGYIDHLDIRNVYSSSKKAAETLCMCYYNQYGVASNIVRPGHIYGPTAKRDDSRVGSLFAYCASDGNNIVLKSDGNQIRSYCYVIDCVTAIFTVLLMGTAPEVYNISNSHSILTIRKLAELYAKSGNVKLEVCLPTEREKLEFNPMNNSSLDSRRLEKLGWNGLFDITTGTSHTIKILREAFL